MVSSDFRQLTFVDSGTNTSTKRIFKSQRIKIFVDLMGKNELKLYGKEFFKNCREKNPNSHN